MSQPVIHLLSLDFQPYIADKFYQSVCGMFFVDRNRVTKDSTAVTCKNCLKTHLANQEKREEDETT